MAGRLLRENMRADRLVGQGRTQTAAETAVIMNERGVRVVRATAQPVVTTKEVQTDGIGVKGTTEFDVLYLTAAGELMSSRAQAGFSGVIPVEGASPTQHAQVKAYAAAVHAGERDGRLELAVQLQLTGLVMERAEIPVAAGVAGQDETAQRFERVCALHTVQGVQTSQTLADTFPLVQEGMKRVVWQQAKPKVQHVLPMDGVVEVSGEVEMNCLLAGETTGDLAWQRVSFPFHTELVSDSLRGEMHTKVHARVRDAEAHLLQAVEEEETTALQAECVMELTAEGTAAQEMNVLADAYPLTEEPFEAVLARVDFIDDLEEAEQTQIVEATLELPPDAPPIRHIMGAFAAPILLENAEGDNMRAEGLLRVTLLYRTDGQDAPELYEQEVPFGVTFDEIGGLAQVWRIEIGDVEAQRITPMQAQVRVQVELEAMEVIDAWMETVQEIREEGEAMQLPSGITLYYPEAQETLWDVAKRYRVSEEALRRRNPEGKAPLLVYRRLTAF